MRIEFLSCECVDRRLKKWPDTTCVLRGFYFLKVVVSNP